ncbi:MAG: hypothetical protein ACRDRA_22315 [Pseudonocardiaceae bacterium]
MREIIRPDPAWVCTIGAQQPDSPDRSGEHEAAPFWMISRSNFIEGDFYRRSQNPHGTKTNASAPACQLTTRKETVMLTDQTWWFLGHGNPLIPSHWQATQM